MLTPVLLHRQGLTSPVEPAKQSRHSCHRTARQTAAALAGVDVYALGQKPLQQDTARRLPSNGHHTAEQM